MFVCLFVRNWIQYSRQELDTVQFVEIEWKVRQIDDMVSLSPRSTTDR